MGLKEADILNVVECLNKHYYKQYKNALKDLKEDLFQELYLSTLTLHQKPELIFDSQEKLYKYGVFYTKPRVYQFLTNNTRQVSLYNRDRLFNKIKNNYNLHSQEEVKDLIEKKGIDTLKKEIKVRESSLKELLELLNMKVVSDKQLEDETYEIEPSLETRISNILSIVSEEEASSALKNILNMLQKEQEEIDVKEEGKNE